MFEIFIKFLKVTLLISIFYYLYNNNYFDLSLFVNFIKNPLLNFILIFLTAFTIFVGGYRWYIILKSFDVKISLFKTLKIHYIASFFNNVLFGTIGGDVLKVHYILKHSDKNKLKNNFTILIDRVFGFLGLSFLGLFSVIIIIIQSDQIKFLYYSFYVALAFIIFFIFLFYIIRKNSFFLKIKYFYLKHYKKFVLAFILSILIFFIVHFSTFLISEYIFKFNIDLNEIFFSNFMSTIVSAVPITPGGIGLSEITFAFTNKYFFENLLNNLANVVIYLRVIDFIVSLPSLYFYLVYKNEKNEI
tara:strand:+ start:1989 stop:2894 length:906 start_codon:yes stop_codon:yes gene_type:complete